jgi:hypothetical protein
MAQDGEVSSRGGAALARFCPAAHPTERTPLALVGMFTFGISSRTMMSPRPPRPKCHELETFLPESRPAPNKLL